MSAEEMLERGARCSERAFCGAVINGDARATDSELKAAWFTIPLCRRIYEASLSIERQGRTVDLPTLDGVLSDEDVSAAIEIMQEASATGALARQHADNIRTAAQRRAIVSECLAAARAANDPDKPVSELLDNAVARLNAITGEMPTQGSVNGVDALVDFYTRLVKGPLTPVMATGIPKLDNTVLIAGGKLIVIGARPSVGKSALLLQMAVKALDVNRRVLIVSLEMSADELIGRMIAQKSGVSSEKIARGKLEEQDWEKVANGLGELNGERFSISETARTVQDVRREALRMRASGGLDLIVVDYLQLLDAGQRTSNRTEAVGAISRSLKQLTQELKIPVLTASQLNRASERNDTPKLSDLRESGSIEQDADTVLLLHAPSENDNPERLLNIAKNRGGRCGTISLWFDGATMRFIEMQGGQT